MEGCKSYLPVFSIICQYFPVNATCMANTLIFRHFANLAKLTPSATHFKKQTCLFMRKFPSNYRHAPLCRYQLADQRCHGLIMCEINDTAVVQIIVENNAH